jgi:hypothetical protein
MFDENRTPKLHEDYEKSETWFGHAPSIFQKSNLQRITAYVVNAVERAWYYNGNLLRAEWPKDVMTSLSSVDIAPCKRSCSFFYMIYPKENIVSAGVLQIFHTKNRSRYREVCIWCMIDDTSLDQILHLQPKQVGYFGTRINWKQPSKIREFGHNARSAMSRFSLAGSSFESG